LAKATLHFLKMEDNTDDSAIPMVEVLAVVLDRLVEANADLESGAPVTKFSAAKRPGISVRDYLVRIHTYARCSPSCFTLALIYVDRLIQRDGFILSNLNVHRVMITACMVSAKFFDDFYFNNAFYARVGGISAAELNDLEVDLLKRLDWNLRVTPHDFDRYGTELVAHTADGAEAAGCEAADGEAEGEAAAGRQAGGGSSTTPRCCSEEEAATPDSTKEAAAPVVVAVAGPAGDGGGAGGVVDEAAYVAAARGIDQRSGEEAPSPTAVAPPPFADRPTPPPAAHPRTSSPPGLPAKPAPPAASRPSLPREIPREIPTTKARRGKSDAGLLAWGGGGGSYSRGSSGYGGSRVGYSWSYASPSFGFSDGIISTSC